MPNYSNFRNQKSKLFIALTLAAGLVPVAGHTAGLAIEEILVTARKVEENLQTTPVAVSSFSENELYIRGVDNLEDIENFAPNVNLGSSTAVSGLSSAPAIFIRGIGQADFVNTADPAVGIYIDGVYVGRSLGSLLDIVDVARIDVLRGPQGTLFGRNNIGGAIDVVSVKPDPFAGLTGTVRFTLGEDNQIESQAAANIPLSDVAALRVSALIKQRDGYVDALQYNDLKLGNDDTMALQGKLRLLLSDSLTLDVAADLTKQNESPAPLEAVDLWDLPTLGPPGGDARLYNNMQGASCDTLEEIATNEICFGNAHRPVNGYTNNSVWTDENGVRVDPEQKMDISGVGITLEWVADIGTFKSISAYREMESSFYNDLDLSPFPIFHNSAVTYDQSQFSQEFQFSGNFMDDQLTLVSGLYYFEEDSLQEVGINRWGGPPPVRPNPNGSFFQYSNRQVNNSSYAAFAQGTYTLTPSLQLTLGLRYTSEEKDFELTLDRQNNNGTILGPIYGNLKTTETTPLVTLGWDVSETVYGYATYTEGFRSGGFPTRFANGFPADIEFYEPEYVDSIELGFKSDLLDGNLRWNVALFRTQYDSIQTPATPVSPTSPTQGNTNIDNLAGAQITGLESELQWVLGDNLRMDLVAGWLNSEITELVGGTLTSNGLTITKDSEIPYTPSFNGSLGVTHSLPLDSGASIMTRVDLSYLGEQYFSIENIPEGFGEAHSHANARITYQAAEGNWQATLGVRNLADDDYFLRKGFAADNGVAFGSRVRPRTFYATYRYDFGL